MVRDGPGWLYGQLKEGLVQDKRYAARIIAEYDRHSATIATILSGVAVGSVWIPGIDALTASIAAAAAATSANAGRRDVNEGDYTRAALDLSATGFGVGGFGARGVALLRSATATKESARVAALIGGGSASGRLDPAALAAAIRSRRSIVLASESASRRAAQADQIAFALSLLALTPYVDVGLEPATARVGATPMRAR